MRTKYTDEHLGFLRENYPKHTRKELYKLFIDRFDMDISFSAFVSTLIRNKIQCGRSGRFEKGHKTWNKGTKGLCKANSGTFKPGHKPIHEQPIGTERIRNGYVFVKVSNTGIKRIDWVGKHVVLWKSVHGEVPKNHVVTFIDGNKENITIENLELITQKENLIRNILKVWEQPPELIPTYKLIAKLMTITSIMKEQKCEREKSLPLKKQ